MPVLLFHFRRNKLDSIIGEMSYPMYISHMFVAGIASGLLFVAGIASRTKAYEWPFFNVCYVIVTIAFSAVLVFLLILPVDRLRSRLGARSP